MSDHYNDFLADCDTDWYMNMCDEDEFIGKLYKKLVEELEEETNIEKKEAFHDEFCDAYRDYLGQTTLGRVNEPYEYLDNITLKDDFRLSDFRLTAAERLKKGLGE